jgi:hypothetical protein
MAGAPTQTTLNANQLEAGCGWGGPGGMFFSESFQDNITANPGGGQANAFQLLRQNSRVTTVASAGDSIMLPPALPGLELVLVNHGLNSMQVFGQGTDTIDDVASATGVPQMADSTTLYYCMNAGMWYSEGLASGYARGSVGAFQTLSVQTGIVAHAGGGQGAAVQLTAMNCFIATVATAGDSVKLPPAKVGMEITVINQSATATGPNVFPATGESINALSANTAIAVAPQTVLIFFCGIAGTWWSK